MFSGDQHRFAEAETIGVFDLNLLVAEISFVDDKENLLFSAALLLSAGLMAQQSGDNSPYSKTLRSFSKWYAGNAYDSIYDNQLKHRRLASHLT